MAERGHQSAVQCGADHCHEISTLQPNSNNAQPLHTQYTVASLHSAEGVFEKKYKCTTESGTSGHCYIGAGRCFMFTLQEAPLFCMKWRHGHHLKLWRQIKNSTQSIDAYIPKKNPAQFHPDLIWNDGALGFFWRGRPNKKKINSDMRSVPDLKKESSAYSYNFPSIICNSYNFQFVKTSQLFRSYLRLCRSVEEDFTGRNQQCQRT